MFKNKRENASTNKKYLQRNIKFYKCSNNGSILIVYFISMK